jgi:hypothetical protein
MKYETPELTTLTPAINVIQNGGGKGTPNFADNPSTGYEAIQAYMDWE